MSNHIPKQIFKAPINETLTNLADPFGLDPVGRRVHEQVFDWAGVGKQSGPTLNQQLQEQQQNQAPPKVPGSTAPNRAEENVNAINQQQEDLKRRSASQVLLTSGQGARDPYSVSKIALAFGGRPKFGGMGMF